MIPRARLDEAAQAGIITPAQAAALDEFLSRGRHAAAADPARARFTFTHVLFYLGGMIAIGALSLFLTLAWERIGATGLLGTAIAYATLAWALAVRFERGAHAVPAALMGALVVVVVPLAVYALQHLLGFWPADGTGAEGYRDYHRRIDWRWLLMELATLAAGAIVLRRFRYAFLVMPIAVTLWYMGMDIVSLLAPDADPWSESVWTLRKWLSIAFGAAMLLAALLVDLRSREARDYAFWLYLFGLATFWGGLTLLESRGVAGKLGYVAINVVLVLLGATLVRRAFAVFGGVGIAVGLGSLAHGYFKDSLAFTAALTGIGLAIIAAGVWWQRHEGRVASRLQAALPRDLWQLLAARRATVRENARP
jgi:hypothetical protein